MIINAPDVLRELPLHVADANIAAVTIADDDEDGAFPADLRNWLVRLRLLEGVPFANLVADTELLPEESIRWFYIDRAWTDALVQGALSVGTVNSDDRTQLTAAYPAARDELDAEERNLRRAVDEARLAGAAGPISGVLLRSRAVAGWPGLSVRAYTGEPLDDDGDVIEEGHPMQMRLLRLERLAPAVLLCLFDGIPEVVHIEEPRQGIQFGFDMEGTSTRPTAKLPIRDVDTFEELGEDATVRFRPGGSGVVDIQNLERELKGKYDESGIGNELDSAEYALQLVRFPFRQVWGDPGVEQQVDDVFVASIAYTTLVTTTFVTETVMNDEAQT